MCTSLCEEECLFIKPSSLLSLQQPTSTVSSEDKERVLGMISHLLTPASGDPTSGGGGKGSRYKCRQCNMTLSSYGSLVRHVEKVHQNVRSWQCGACNKTFKEIHHVRKHLRCYHKVSDVHEQRQLMVRLSGDYLNL